MHPVIEKTFGGLSARYYFRQLFFGLLLAGFVFALVNGGGVRPVPGGMLAYLIINTLLYPYSRFVYESIVGFIVGENVFFGNALLVLVVKLFTMMICWALAIFVAPLGLAYLYFHHSRPGLRR